MDEAYLNAAASLDDMQLERLIEAYWRDVWNYAFVMTRDREASEDLAQETFIRAFRSLSSFRGQSTYRTWLLRIVRNLAINHNRRLGLFRRMAGARHRAASDASSSAEAEFWRRQEMDEIWLQVMRLPVRQREVLLLHAKYDLSMTDIADLLRIPEGTVKSRLSRARSQMSEWLKGENR